MIQRTNNILLFIITFFTFFGFYETLLLTIQLGIGSRIIAVSIRALLGISFLLFLLINHISGIKMNIYTRCFLFYSFIYGCRIFIDYLYHENYFLSSSYVSLYFISSAFIPFVILSMFKINEYNYKFIKNSLLLSSIIFSVSILVFYSKYIGVVGRLSANTTGDDDVISPLILSYCSIISISVLSSYLLYNKERTRNYVLFIGTIIISLVSLFLGASRGSLIALAVPFLLIMIFRRNFKTLVIGTLLLVILIFILIYLDSKFSSSLMERFFSLSKDIDEGSTSAIRLNIWEASFNQFLFNPFWGDKLRVDNFDGAHPHNIILEVLQTTGIIGFIPFIILLFSSFKASIKIIKTHPSYIWIVVLFVQSLIQNLFSGATYTASWFWVSMALLLCTYNYLKYEKGNIYEN